jgi:hypothetical protein
MSDIYDIDSNPWFTKDRSESTSFRVNRSFENIDVLNPGIGLNIYQSAIPDDVCKKSIKTLEDKLTNGKVYKWSEAQVTTSNKPVKSARDCVDFKFKQENLGQRNENNSDLLDMHQSIYDVLKKCVDDYCQYWGISVVYYEAFNFVKYSSPGQHFRVHADHGPAYNCTVSAVICLNDDYEGGEIAFPRLDKLVYKPKRGDVVIFPSNYIYEHSSEPMISGDKYSVVIMMDINLLGHKENN